MDTAPPREAPGKHAEFFMEKNTRCREPRANPINGRLGSRAAVLKNFPERAFDSYDSVTSFSQKPNYPEMNGKRALDENQNEGDSSHLPRRQKTRHYLEDRVYESEKDLSAVERDRYTIAWVCALYTELAAAQAMLDEIHDAVATDPNDSNTYILGSIGRHNVVIACLPDTQYGTDNAANVLTNLVRTFKFIRLGLMVGIGGGVPSTVDIRLGDIVVGTRVMQYDLGKIVEDGEIQRTAIAKIPHSSAGTVISTLRAKHTLGQSRIPSTLREKLGEHPNYGRPDLPDRLFSANSQHISSTASCDECDESKNAEEILRHYEQWLVEQKLLSLYVLFRNPLMEKLDQDSSHDRRQEILDSLKYDEINSRKTDIRSAHEKTCRWFLKHPDYKDWLDPARQSDHCGFLWIRGKPGAGKSTIMKFIYGKTRKAARNAVVASFFFHARGGILEKSISGMYRSLLLQLFEGYPDLQTVLDDTDLIPKNQNGCPPLNVLKDLFTNAVSSLGERPFTCFIDALDECDEQEVRTMVQDIEDLAERSTTIGTPLRICFSSRHYPYIDIDRGIKLTLESQSGHSQDLESYVRNRLRMGKGVMAEELRAQILQKAAGVFLWVVLVVDILNKENSRGRLAIQKRLSELPGDLSALFKDMLKRDSENMEELLLCIIWILYAKQPLSPGEYYHALWSGLSLKNLVDKDIPVVTLPDAKDIISNCVTSSSKGLAEITKSNRPTVQFIHESVRDFLIKDRGLQELWPDHSADLESLSHERLKESCNAYMSHRSAVTTEIERESATHPIKISINYPFLEYASQNILFHANSAARAVPQDNFLLAFNSAVPDWIDTLNIFEKFKTRQYKRRTGLLYILAEKNLANLIRIHPDRYSCFKVERERYGPPLLAALALGSHEAVQVLLEAQAQVSSGSELHELCHLYSQQNHERIALGRSFEFSRKKGIFAHLLETGDEILPLFSIYSVQKGQPDLDNRLGLSPLSHAARLGNEKCVGLLLEKDVDTSWKPANGMSPLHHATSQDNEVVFRLLYEKSSGVRLPHYDDDGDYIIPPGGYNAIDSKDHEGRTPLSHAVSNGNEAIVLALLERNVNVDSLDNQKMTPLSHAVKAGHEVVLEKSAIVDSPDQWGKTPLFYAVGAGHEAVVRLLLEKGVNINHVRPGMGTALHQAIGSKQEQMVRFLLENNIDSSIRNTFGNTALHRAAILGDEVIFKLVLDKSADVDPRGHNGSTPLSLAASEGHLKIFQQLLATGRVDADRKNDYGETPLFKAAKGGHQEIVKDLVLINYVNPNSRNNRGETPLAAACSGNNTISVVRRLLATERVDPDSKDNFQDTPLLNASRQGREAIVQQLLSTGRVNTNSKNRDGNTPLMLAVIGGYPKVVEQLLAPSSVEADSQNNNSQTPLLLAVLYGNETIVRQLLGTGRVDTESASNTGRTPLSVAIERDGGSPTATVILQLLRDYRRDKYSL
ncbi:hypothetical protein TWF970_006918 [Orbilia oligospora]|uniref:Nephrocystin 3-like N-terminal domain-containing protein n=1 Tax=Orbilia oligospora TaxID=2813651 RepID=A0A7C8R5B3_ORBOL|nr:hypothetical protein TWF970_006918 [Orbilia oligospora]